MLALKDVFGVWANNKLTSNPRAVFIMYRIQETNYGSRLHKDHSLKHTVKEVFVVCEVCAVL